MSVPADIFAGRALRRGRPGPQRACRRRARCAAMGAERDAWDDQADARAAPPLAERLTAASRDLARRSTRWSCRPASRIACRAPHPRRRARAQRAPASRSCRMPSCCTRRCAPPGRARASSASPAPTASPPPPRCSQHILASAGRDGRGRRQSRPRRAGPAAAAATTACMCWRCRPTCWSDSRPLRFDAAAMLNLSPDHLDRHGDMAGYAAAKRAIFDRQDCGDLAVVGIDDAPSARDGGADRPRAVTDLRRARGRCLVRRRGILRDADGADPADGRGARPARRATTRRTPPPPPPWRCALGVDRAAIARRHRAATPACRTASSAWRRSTASPSSTTARRPTPTPPPARWPATTASSGSPAAQAKAGGIEPLAPFFPRIAHALLIGRDAPVLAAHARPRTACRTAIVGTLDARRAAAARPLRRAHGAEVVLLSPACASLDQFTGFDARGDRFRDARRAPSPRGGPPDAALSRADTSVAGPLVVDGRPLDAARHRGADRLRLRDDAGRPPGGGRAHPRQRATVFILKQVVFLALAGCVVVARLPAVAARRAAAGAGRLRGRAGC